MTKLIDHPVRVDVLDEVVVDVTFADDVEAWLHTQTEPDVPVRWLPQGGGRVTVRNPEHLAELVAALTIPGAWGVLERPVTSRWAQTMRIDHGWIIEVDGGSGPDAFARRVRWAEDQTPHASNPRMRCTNSAGGRGATYFFSEWITSSAGAAQIMWTWLRGRLAEGYELREVTDGVD